MLAGGGAFLVFEGIVKRTIEIGILFSRSGDYQLLSNDSRQGVLAGIEAVNEDARRPFQLRARERDPEGQIERYGSLCAELLRDEGVQHIFGCTTSWSRKEVIPVLERHDGLLWYTCPYEGFETNDHVIYAHACPNQHIVPLLAFLMPRFGSDAFLLGSNYIWGWEVNRVARDLISDVDGKVLGERYLPLGDTGIERLLRELQAARPSFILNNLIGRSSHAFLDVYAELGRNDRHFSPENCPVVSCNFTEAELPAIGGAADGLVSVGPFFASPDQPRASSLRMAAHAAVLMLADAIEAAGTADPDDVRKALDRLEVKTPLGQITIDGQTQHTSLPVRIARVVDGAFDVIWESQGRQAPDPYLSYLGTRPHGQRPQLKVVS